MKIAISLLLASFVFSISGNANKTADKKVEIKKEDSKNKQAKNEKTVKVKLETSMGNIILELDKAKAKKTVENFISYVKDGHYDGTIFHRVIDGFMIQGGGFDKNMKQKPTKSPIKNEADNGLRNEDMSLAMARTNDPHSATAQFFINVNDNSFLNHTDKSTRGWGYAVFGKVIEGKDVVKKIKAVKTGAKNGMRDVPLEVISIKKASLL